MSTVRFRIDLTPGCSIGPGKIQLLEGIARTGSLRRAASELRMSYRRAWLLLDEINHQFNEPSTVATIGGAGGGGAILTTFGSELVQRYRAAARRMEAVARAEFGALAPRARAEPRGDGRPNRRKLVRSPERRP
jgi:molybdate transport system regulatory protein